MTRTMQKSAAALIGCAFALLAAPAHAASGWALLNMPEGVTELSKKIYDLHMMIFWWCVAIGIFVFGWMIWAIVAFRKSKGAVANTAMVHSTKAEIIWTLIPVGILVAMSVPSARVLIDIEDARNTELTVRVTAYQWKWQYQYLGTDVGYYSTLAHESNTARQLQSGIDPQTVPNYLLDVDHPLVVPAGTSGAVLRAGGLGHADGADQCAGPGQPARSKRAVGRDIAERHGAVPDGGAVPASVQGDHALHPRDQPDGRAAGPFPGR